MIETNRLKIYAASRKVMEEFIQLQTVEELKTAYTEMLEGCLRYSEQWEWYAIWMIELKDGTHIGELSFKGMGLNGVVEIGYGISTEYQGKGYAAEAVSAIVHWAVQQPGITSVEAETAFENVASQRVLEKCGFIATGNIGGEGPRFVWSHGNEREIGRGEACL